MESPGSYNHNTFRYRVSSSILHRAGQQCWPSTKQDPLHLPKRSSKKGWQNHVDSLKGLTHLNPKVWESCPMSQTKQIDHLTTWQHLTQSGCVLRSVFLGNHNSCHLVSVPRESESCLKKKTAYFIVLLKWVVAPSASWDSLQKICDGYVDTVLAYRSNGQSLEINPEHRLHLRAETVASFLHWSCGLECHWKESLILAVVSSSININVSFWTFS